MLSIFHGHPSVAKGKLYARSRRPWTTWVPVIIVLGVSMVKEGIEDYRRYRADREVNSRIVEVCGRLMCVCVCVCVYVCIEASSLSLRQQQQHIVVKQEYYCYKIHTRAHTYTPMHSCKRTQILDVATGTFVGKPWRNVLVGDIVRTKKDETFSADVLFLGTRRCLLVRARSFGLAWLCMQ